MCCLALGNIQYTGGATGCSYGTHIKEIFELFMRDILSHIDLLTKYISNGIFFGVLLLTRYPSD